MSMHVLQAENQALSMKVQVLQDEMERIKRQLVVTGNEPLNGNSYSPRTVCSQLKSS